MDQSETFRQLANCYRNTVHCSCYYSSYAHQTSNMDILMKYATIISDTIDGPNTLSLLKEDGYIKWASYLTLSSYQDAKQQTLKLVHQLVAQENHKAIARLFEILCTDESFVLTRQLFTVIAENFWQIEDVIPKLSLIIPCYLKEDHQNQMGYFMCTECNPHGYEEDWWRSYWCTL